MLVAIHQLHYLPWLRYVEKIARADTFIVLDSIQYNKNGWQNRNKIKTSSGAEILTVPVSFHTGVTLDHVAIPPKHAWREKHWKSIRQHYGKAPFFEEHAPFLESTYQREWTLLNALNRHMLAYFLDALGIQTRIAFSSELDVSGIATERLMNLIRAVGGTRYYTGAYALDVYLDADAMAAAGIALEIQEWRPKEYPQRYGEFIPDLCILDLLLNCGPDSLDMIVRSGRS